MPRLLYTCILLTCAAPALAVDPPAPKPEPPGVPGTTPQTVLRLATSSDGLRFSEPGEVFVRGGSAPALVRLESGELLAVFEYATKTDNPNKSSLYASRSKDAGKTWLPPRPVGIRGLADKLRIGRPTLVVMPSGLVRMYFTTAEPTDRARARTGASIQSAVTRDGIEYRLDRQVRIDVQGKSSTGGSAGTSPAARCVAFWTDKQMMLLVSGETSSSAGGSRAGAVQQFTSRDGRTFWAPDRARQAGSIGHVLQLDGRHWRMYISSGGAIYSRLSSDGLRWQGESGACLKNGLDAAVAPAGKGKYLMLVASPVSKQDETAKALVTIAADATAAGVAKNDRPQPRTGDVGANAPQPVAPPSDTNTPSTSWDSFTQADFGSELGDEANEVAGDPSEALPSDAQGFAPVPDLSGHFDYIAWYEQNFIQPPGQNAYESYRNVFAAMDMPDEVFRDRYNAGDQTGPPAPWRPADQPKWEECFQAQQNVFEQLRAASQDPRPWSTEMTWPEGQDHLLYGCLLPSLNVMRGANRAMMSQAWRTETGTVPAEQMQDAVSTVLGTVAHLQNGTTLIERLVAFAQRNLAEENARWALKQGVFTSAADIEAALNMLQERDVPEIEPGRWILGEQAAHMDVIQYLFEPSQAGDEPRFRSDRWPNLSKFTNGLGSEEDVEALQNLSLDEVRGSIEAINAFHHELKANWDASWPYT
ncbi:MAG: exo-alpha-sialidase, partial [Planctomycetes bacterium]|nr:exo-alpha-sialidase [Planctomycetota bacterium]